jgi:hypothetical protein
VIFRTSVDIPVEEVPVVLKLSAVYVATTFRLGVLAVRVAKPVGIENGSFMLKM